MFWEKLLLLCNQYNVSPAAVANGIGLSNAAATNWKHGAVPRDTTIQKVASFFNVSKSFFSDNEDKERQKKVEEALEQFNTSMGAIQLNLKPSNPEQVALEEELKRRLREFGKEKIEAPVFVPVYESVSAGFGALASSEVVDQVPCILRPNEADEYIGIKVEGDSMYPKIEDGDTVIVHKQTSVDSGALAVVLVDGEEGFVKRVEYGPDWINLISLNPMYPPMRFKDSEVTRVSVQGRVTKVIKDV